MHLTRYSMYRRIRTALDTPISGRVLGISGIENFGDMMAPEAEILDTSYPDVDVENLQFSDAQFDWVISDQVLEHIAHPPRAIAESFRVLKPGGIAIHTTCFLNPLHRYPEDYFRFSCAALASLVEPYAEVLHCASWGNRYAAALIMVADRIRGMHIPDGGGPRHWLATYNEEKYPIHVWVIARRKGW